MWMSEGDGKTWRGRERGRGGGRVDAVGRWVRRKVGMGQRELVGEGEDMKVRKVEEKERIK